MSSAAAIKANADRAFGRGSFHVVAGGDLMATFHGLENAQSCASVYGWSVFDWNGREVFR